jgi:hypothetical protein
VLANASLIRAIASAFESQKLMLSRRYSCISKLADFKNSKYLDPYLNSEGSSRVFKLLDGEAVSPFLVERCGLLGSILTSLEGLAKIKHSSIVTLLQKVGWLYLRNVTSEFCSFTWDPSLLTKKAQGVARYRYCAHHLHLRPERKS